MATPESKVKLEVKALLKPYVDSGHMFTDWPVPYGYGKSVLDCHGCWRGTYFAIETKAPGETLTARQAFTKAQIEAAGGIVFVIGEARVDGEYTGMQDLKNWLLT